ncbi:acyl-CoA thioesterase [Verrucomicrobiaceae bacterium N1E253]|uniref:Acyl-CoA thioesterase n=1 Tax=Oceaniferula marina TaxID=2748318 RepID=A0A851G9L0_9BACT|nr:acyl-CoA thioesterase [Oceaniferula marina]NWK54106.1 acyl-CoA thioesterase [Oceaniferula marina]
MITHRLVLPEDLNQYGFLFGGKMLAWVDEASWIAASLDFPGCHFVTVGMDKVEFHHGVAKGVILEIQCVLVKQGRTSVTYQVEVRQGSSKDQGVIFSTCVSFVNVDSDGSKKELGDKIESTPSV